MLAKDAHYTLNFPNRSMILLAEAINHVKDTRIGYYNDNVKKVCVEHRAVTHKKNQYCFDETSVVVVVMRTNQKPLKSECHIRNVMCVIKCQQRE